MTAVDEIAEVLAGFAVHVGFPAKRAELAGYLVGEGVSADEVEVLGTHCEKTVTDGEAAVARILVSLLTNAAKRAARLEDLGVVRAAKSARAAKADPVFGDRPTGPAPAPDEPREAWEHDRACRAAYCGIVSDRRRPEVLARELGVAEEQLDAMVERGRMLCQSPLSPDAPPLTIAAAAKSDRESDARRLEFRRQMRADAAKSVVKRKPLDFERMNKEAAKLLAQARTSRGIDMGAVIADRVKLGALATLEADGVILRNGPADAAQFQPYLVAKDAGERKQFRARMAEWDRQHNHRVLREVPK